jgi:hypothetical protein
LGGPPRKGPTDLPGGAGGTALVPRRVYALGRTPITSTFWLRRTYTFPTNGTEARRGEAGRRVVEAHERLLAHAEKQR